MRGAISTALMLMVFWCVHVNAQAPAAGQIPQTADSPIDNTLVAGDSDADVPVRKLVSWNEYEGKWFSIRAGGGFLVDYAAFAQDDASKQQVRLDSKFQLRDARALFRGKLNLFKSRSVTWSSGIMYNSPTHTWQFRQTGIMVGVPEIWGSIFLGRTKEGVSLNKVMIGLRGLDDGARDDQRCDAANPG